MTIRIFRVSLLLVYFFSGLSLENHVVCMMSIASNFSAHWYLKCKNMSSIAILTEEMLGQMIYCYQY
jgi:hypothetical protein